jgi:hypothetical protein
MSNSKPAGDIEFKTDVLPKHVAVQLTPGRWIIAELIDPENEWNPPAYRAIDKAKLFLGDAHNALVELQAKTRKTEAEKGKAP